MKSNCEHNWEYTKENAIVFGSKTLVKKRYCKLCGKKQVFIRNPFGKTFDEGEWVNTKF